MAKLRIELHWSQQAHFVIKKPVTEQEKLNFSYVGVNISISCASFVGTPVFPNGNVSHIHSSE